MKIKIKKVIFILLSLIGMLILIIGIYQSDIQLKTILISFGGSIFGASLSNFFSLLGFNIYDVLNNSSNMPNINKGKKLNTFRKKYFCYYKTKYADGIHWRMYIVDYSNFFSNNYLLAKIEMKDDEGNKKLYKSIGLLVENRLITIAKPIHGGENSTIYFFPNFGKEYSDKSVGIGIFENWSNEEMVSTMIMSKKSIEGYKKIGKINNPKLENHLQAIIDEETSKMTIKI